MHVYHCKNRGELHFGADADSQISAALRDKLRLLAPEQIRANLKVLKLNQKEAAERLGTAAATMSRWLTGAMIQSRAMDNLLRAFFGSIKVRQHLSSDNPDRRFGARVKQNIAR